ncbi:MAG: chloride channel protein, partial [Anaerolineales bacterium]
MTRAFRLFREFSSSPFQLGSLAVLVGLASGAGVWLFKWLIEALHHLTFGMLPGWAVLFIPILGGLLVGWLA